MSFIAAQPVKEISISAIVTRADGTVEDLGTISYWHQNPLKRWAWVISRWMRGKRAGSIKQG